MAEKKVKKPDFLGPGIAIWKDTDRNGNEYLIVRLFGKDGILVNCFPVK